MTWTRRAESALRAALPTDVDVVVVADSPARDLDVHVGGGSVRVRWLPVGWPREVEATLNARRRPDVVVAPIMSPGARSAAERAGVGWLDETGAANISLSKPIVIVKTDGTPRVPLESKVGWRRSTLAVCEALIAGTAQGTVNSVVAATGLSLGSATSALKFLETQGYLESSASRGPSAERRIVDRDLLLDGYATAAARLRVPTAVQVGVLWRDPAVDVVSAGRMWDAQGITWAMTSALSASLLAPFLTEPAPLEVYVEGRTPGDLHRVAQAAGLSAIAGGRLTLRPFPTSAGSVVTAEVAPGAHSVLWPRAFADLRVVGVRGDEAAEHLREVMTA